MMKTLGSSIFLAGLLTCAAAVQAAETAAQRDQRMEWWREARLGMFIHWGLYSGVRVTLEPGYQNPYASVAVLEIGATTK
jgi:alpha-L-fucosidase